MFTTSSELSHLMGGDTFTPLNVNETKDQSDASLILTSVLNNRDSECCVSVRPCCTHISSHWSGLQVKVLTNEHLIHDDPQRPPVTELVVPCLHENLWGDVVWCSHCGISLKTKRVRVSLTKY